MRKFFVVLLIFVLFTLPTFGQGGRDYNARVLKVSRWIDLSGRLYNRVVMPFTDGDTTPSVYNSNIFKEANTGATTITTFDNAIAGQQIAILFTTANTTIDFTGTNLLGNIGVDWTSSANDILTAIYDGTNWYCEIEGGNRATLQTTTVDQQTCGSFTLADNNVYGVTAEVTAFEDGVNRAYYKITAMVYRDGGGATLGAAGAVSLHTDESEGTWDATFTVSGNDLRISVTGEAATTIEWASTIQYSNVGS